MPPTYLIIILFIIAFCISSWQYFILDPARRIWNVPFGLMAGAALAVTAYPLYVQLYPGDRITAWILLLLGAVWVALAVWFRRRMRRRGQGRKFA